MEDGGHITGWLVEGKDVDEFNKALTEYTATVGEKYTGLKGTPMVFAVGDGNHSLATAKSLLRRAEKEQPRRRSFEPSGALCARRAGKHPRPGAGRSSPSTA